MGMGIDEDTLQAAQDAWSIQREKSPNRAPKAPSVDDEGLGMAELLQTVLAMRPSKLSHTQSPSPKSVQYLSKLSRAFTHQPSKAGDEFNTNDHFRRAKCSAVASLPSPNAKSKALPAAACPRPQPTSKPTAMPTPTSTPTFGSLARAHSLDGDGAEDASDEELLTSNAVTGQTSPLFQARPTVFRRLDLCHGTDEDGASRAYALSRAERRPSLELDLHDMEEFDLGGVCDTADIISLERVEDDRCTRTDTQMMRSTMNLADDQGIGPWYCLSTGMHMLGCHA